VQALAGLAVAGGLIVTYRTYRQNRVEQDRTYERELYARPSSSSATTRPGPPWSLVLSRTPREVVAQILDYGSWAQDLSLSEVTELYAEHQGGALDEAFVETFGSAVPDTFNADQRLAIVASELDAASDRIVTFLASRYDVPINAVFFRYFVDGESEYLARTWLRPPEEAEAGRPGSRSQRAGSVGGSHPDYSEASFLTVMLGCGPCVARESGS